MRGEVAIGPSIYGVYVIDGSLCSRVYGILGWGGVSSGHKCKIQLNAPPSFLPNYDAKRGAYNRASTVYDIYIILT